MKILVTGGAGFICADYVPGEITSGDVYAVEFDGTDDAYDAKGCHAASAQRATQAFRVVQGEVFDVAVDLSKNCKTFGR